jgi:hypothetical protein
MNKEIDKKEETKNQEVKTNNFKFKTKNSDIKVGEEKVGVKNLNPNEEIVTKKKWFLFGLILILTINFVLISIFWHKRNQTQKEVVFSQSSSNSTNKLNNDFSNTSQISKVAIDYYQNKEYNFSFQYPKSWKIQENTDTKNNSSQKNENTFVVTKILPEVKEDSKSDKNSFEENIVFLINTKPEVKNLNLLVDQELKKISENSEILDYKLISKEKTNLDNALGFKVVETFNTNSASIKQTQYFILKKEVLYIINFTSKIENYEKNLMHFEELVKSLKL